MRDMMIDKERKQRDMHTWLLSMGSQNVYA